MTIRRLVPNLPRAAWTVLAGDAISSAGTGLTLPFLIVYLHRVRGVALEPAALALSVLALAGFAGNPLSGACADRIGARNTLIGGLVISALGAGGLAVVGTAAQGLMAAALVGLGAAVIWPAQDTLLARVVAPEQRSAAFSLRYATMNAALGLGALASAALVDVRSPASFVSIYLLDAASFLAFIPFLLGLSAGERGFPGADDRSGADDRIDAPRTGYRVLARDATFVRVWLLTALLVMIGYAQMDAALPIFATRPGGITANQLAIAFAANTVTVVVAQLVVLRLMRGRRRTSGLLVLCSLWALTWLLTLAAGGLGDGAAAVAGFVAANVSFALGETLISPTLPAIVNDLAPDDLRGRYNGAYVLAWTTGFAAGPAVAGAAIGAGYTTALFGALIAACGWAALLTMRLGRRIPAAANRLADDDQLEAGAVLDAGLA